MAKWKDVSKTLESIARSYDEDSVQFKAIEEAARTYAFLNMHDDLKKAYESFCMQCDKELSEIQKQHLRQMGIEP
jgi:hypothetical protein